MPEYLCAGQIGDPTVPTVGAKLYYLAESSYGSQVSATGGDDSLLRLESDDIPLGGEGARVLVRRIYLKLRHDGALTLQVTPIIDLDTPLTPVGASYAANGIGATELQTVAVAQLCTHLRVRVEVLSRTGLVDVLQCWIAVKPLARAADVLSHG